MKSIKQVVTLDRVTQYAYDVLDGKIIAGKSVKLACKRHLNDLKKSKTDDFEYIFDIERVEHVLNFSETLTFKKGKVNKPLELYPFQAFLLGSLYGWVNKDTGFRRFRQSYIQVGKQQGKTLINGLLVVYNSGFTGDNNCKLYLGATTSKQAKLVYNNAINFINSDADLAELYTIKEYNNTIKCNATGNEVETIARLSEGNDTLDGIQGIYCSLDEYHLHKNNLVYGLFKDGQKSLPECLLSIITTAGYTIDGACHKLYRYCKELINGDIEDDSVFVYIAELDKDDDLDNYKNWYKANPTLEYNNLNIKIMESSYKQAKRMGGKDWNTFLTKNLNMWVEFTEVKYMNMTAWHKCASTKTLENFRGQEFILSLDLSSGGDLTSAVFEFTYFEKNKETGNMEKKYFVHHHSFIPASRVEEHEKTDNAEYKLWIQKKLLTATTALGGIKTDYKEILKYVKEQIKKYDLKLKMICYDPANASAFLADLEEFGVDCLDIYQNSKSLNDATMDIKYEVEAGNIEYNENDELLTWAMNNCELTKPWAGKVMLDKNSRFKRIDPVAAFVDAHKMAMRKEVKPVKLTEQYIADFYKN